MALQGPAGPFTLKARADRIDTGAGGIVITDYKSGANLKPLVARAKQGEAPQLPLEAAIAAVGGFTGIAAGRVALLRYISTSGGEPPGADFDLDLDDRRRQRRCGARRAAAADRRVRSRVDALSRRAASALPLRLRRLRAPGAGCGVVGRESADAEEV